MIAKKTVETAAVLLAAAGRRSYAVVSNHGTATAYLAWDGSSDVSGPAGEKPGQILPPGGSVSQAGLAPQGSPAPAIYASCPDGSTVLSIETN